MRWTEDHLALQEWLEEHGATGVHLEVGGKHLKLVYTMLGKEHFYPVSHTPSGDYRTTDNNIRNLRKKHGYPETIQPEERPRRSLDDLMAEVPLPLPHSSEEKVMMVPEIDSLLAVEMGKVGLYKVGYRFRVPKVIAEAFLKNGEYLQYKREVDTWTFRHASTDENRYHNTLKKATYGPDYEIGIYTSQKEDKTASFGMSDTLYTLKNDEIVVTLPSLSERVPIKHLTPAPKKRPIITPVGVKPIPAPETFVGPQPETTKRLVPDFKKDPQWLVGYLSVDSDGKYTREDIKGVLEAIRAILAQNTYKLIQLKDKEGNLKWFFDPVGMRIS